jgi:hypothetical protein
MCRFGNKKWGRFCKITFILKNSGGVWVKKNGGVLVKSGGVLVGGVSKHGSDVKSRSSIVEEEVDIVVSASQRPQSNLT